jgi:hypothetical protein
MGYSYQRYLIAVDDTIYRMANAAFDRMLRAPTTYCLPELAGQRVRTAEVVVGLVDREPVAVVRTSFAVLVVDDAGCVDADRYRKQQYARVETALAPAFAPALADPDRDEKVVDAASQFIAQGGAWSPTVALARALGDTALGRQKCPRLGNRASKA